MAKKEKVKKVKKLSAKDRKRLIDDFLKQIEKI